MTTIAMSRHPLYSIWSAMKARCNRPDHPQYARYGGRGITVCQRWQDSFLAFLDDVGERRSKNLSIDRIDNDGNYEPGNVRWATQVQQCNNTCRSKAKDPCWHNWNTRVTKVHAVPA